MTEPTFEPEFSVVRAEFDEDGNRTIHEAELRGVSVVSADPIEALRMSREEITGDDFASECARRSIDAAVAKFGQRRVDRDGDGVACDK